MSTRFITSLFSFSLCAVLLTGCGNTQNPQQSAAVDPAAPWGEAAQEKPAPKMEPHHVMATGEPQMIHTYPDAMDSPMAAGVVDAQPLGLNTNATFNAMAMEKRMAHLEADVRDLRGDFNRLLPALNELISAQSRMQTTIQSIARPVTTPVMAAPEVKPAPAPTPKPQSVAEKPAPKMTGKKEVLAMRIGEHPDKTRLVLDLGAPVDFDYNLDNEEKILLIDLKDAAWKAVPSVTLKDSKVVRSANVKTNGNTVLILELKTKADLTMARALSPDGEKGHRLVFDIVGM